MDESTPESQTLHDSSPRVQSGATGVQAPLPGGPDSMAEGIEYIRAHLRNLRGLAASHRAYAAEPGTGHVERMVAEARAAGADRMADEVEAALDRLTHVLDRRSIVVEQLTADVMHELRAPAVEPERAPRKNASVRPYRDERRDFDRAYWRRVLALASGNISEAARLADKTRKEVYVAIERLGLEDERTRLVARSRGVSAEAVAEARGIVS